MGNIVYPLIIWKIWIIHSTSSYFLSSHYVCFGTGEGFTLDTIYEIWQRQFNKVIEFRFKSCFLYYWLSTSGVSQSFYTSVSSFAKRGWYRCSAMTVCITQTWGIEPYSLHCSDCLQASSWLWCMWLCAPSSFLIPNSGPQTTQF